MRGAVEFDDAVYAVATVAGDAGTDSDWAVGHRRAGSQVKFVQAVKEWRASAGGGAGFHIDDAVRTLRGIDEHGRGDSHGWGI